MRDSRFIREMGFEFVKLKPTARSGRMGHPSSLPGEFVNS